ncbi:MAG: hypothetical protein ACRCX4_02690 [Bacteroidales bacterium]
MKQKILLLLVTLILGATSMVSAQQIGRWEKLGERNVQFRSERDAISCRGKGTFTRLKIRVKDAPVEFSKVIVKYGNGTSQELYVRQLIPAGGETREIDLRGNKRTIKEVVFYYKSKKGYKWGKHKRATVSVWGRH